MKKDQVIDPDLLPFFIIEAHLDRFVSLADEIEGLFVQIHVDTHKFFLI